MASTSNGPLSVLAFFCLSACTVTPATTTRSDASSAAGDAAPVNQTSLPAELHGVWLDSWSASMQYRLARNAYDFDTGVWFGGLPDLWDMAPDRGLGLAFGEDGSFLWIQSADGGVGGCQSYSVRVTRGIASVDGGAVRFHPTAQRERYHSTCDASLDDDRALPNEDFAMPYEAGTTEDVGRPTLKLLDPASGTTFVFFHE